MQTTRRCFLQLAGMALGAAAPRADVTAPQADPIVGGGPKCQGGQTLATIRRLAGSREVERKIVDASAHCIMRL